MFPTHPEIATTAENGDPHDAFPKCVIEQCQKLLFMPAQNQICGAIRIWRLNGVRREQLFAWWSKWSETSWQCWEQGSNHFLHLEKQRFKTKYQHTCKPVLLQDLRYHQEVTNIILACQILSWQIPWPNYHLQWRYQWTTGRKFSYMNLDEPKNLLKQRGVHFARRGSLSPQSPLWVQPA